MFILSKRDTSPFAKSSIATRRSSTSDAPFRGTGILEIRSRNCSTVSRAALLRLIVRRVDPSGAPTHERVRIGQL
jgi:hypothetical protein